MVKGAEEGGARSRFHAHTLKPKVTKLGQGEELLEFANGDEFTGTSCAKCHRL